MRRPDTLDLVEVVVLVALIWPHLPKPTRRPPPGWWIQKAIEGRYP